MVIFGVGTVCGGPTIGMINDKFGGGKPVIQGMIVMHVITYVSFIGCTVQDVFGFLCFFSGFLLGMTDTALMTQLSIIIANEFETPA